MIIETEVWYSKIDSPHIAENWATKKYCGLVNGCSANMDSLHWDFKPTAEDEP